ncbi:hypothetical protein E6R62_36845 [Streptomyces sp. A1136]|nr:hypothetical protein E6R62_36845 [Streptomyces sp. A1136]
MLGTGPDPREQGAPPRELGVPGEGCASQPLQRATAEPVPHHHPLRVKRGRAGSDCCQHLVFTSPGLDRDGLDEQVLCPGGKSPR